MTHHGDMLDQGALVATHGGRWLMRRAFKERTNWELRQTKHGAEFQGSLIAYATHQNRIKVFRAQLAKIGLHTHTHTHTCR